MLNLMSTALFGDSRLFAGSRSRIVGLMEYPSFRRYVRYLATHDYVPIWFSVRKADDLPASDGEMIMSVNSGGLNGSQHVALSDLVRFLQGKRFEQALSLFVKHDLNVPPHLRDCDYMLYEDLLADIGVSRHGAAHVVVERLAVALARHWTGLIGSESFPRIADDRFEWNRMYGELHHVRRIYARSRLWLVAHSDYDRIEMESRHGFPPRPSAMAATLECDGCKVDSSEVI